MAGPYDVKVEQRDDQGKYEVIEYAEVKSIGIADPQDVRLGVNEWEFAKLGHVRALTGKRETRRARPFTANR